METNDFESLHALQQRFLALDTAAVSDAMDSLSLHGSLADIDTRVYGHLIAGPAFTVIYRSFDRADGEFHNAGNYIDQVPRGSIVLIDNEGRSDCTNWGGILTEMAKIKNLAGTVVYGAARDMAEIRRMDYPLFTRAVNMVSGKNRVRIVGLQQKVVIGAVGVCPGDWIIADDNGVLAIPKQRLEEVLERAESIDRTEARIRQAIRAGVPLEEARMCFRYDRPWQETA